MPMAVRKIILAALAAGWSPKQRQKNLSYSWSADEKLTAVTRSHE
jgi:hypothetical protein